MLRYLLRVSSGFLEIFWNFHFSFLEMKDNFMENLPVELITKIFSYISDHNIVTASQVSAYFQLVAATQIREVDLKISTERSDQIKKYQDVLSGFQALRKIKLAIYYDSNNVLKAKLCHHFSDQLTQLALREMTFLNPYFCHPNISLVNLESLIIENSDLSSSDRLPQFILQSCPRLKTLTISGCSGLEIESLEYIGQRLNQTQIEHFQLLPTYSYFDSSQSSSIDHHWTLDNLKSLSIRSKLVVMKKNFVRNLIGRSSGELRALELIAELDLGDNLASRIIHNYPNLEKLSLGKGCSIITNEDFYKLCNFYKNMKSFEFHFSQAEESLDLRRLNKNFSINELTIGITKNISTENLTRIASCLPNVSKLRIVLYYLSPSNQEFLILITKIFPNVQTLEFQRTGMSQNMKFTAIKEEVDSPNSRHFDDIKHLSNWNFVCFKILPV